MPRYFYPAQTVDLQLIVAELQNHIYSESVTAGMGGGKGGLSGFIQLNRRGGGGAGGKEGWQPLIWAARACHVQIAEQLLKNGARVNEQEHASSHSNKSSPLHMACYKGHLEMIKLLLRSNADMSLKDVNGSTPKAVAERKGFKEVVELLNTYAAHPERASELLAPQLPLDLPPPPPAAADGARLGGEARRASPGVGNKAVAPQSTTPPTTGRGAGAMELPPDPPPPPAAPNGARLSAFGVGNTAVVPQSTTPPTTGRGAGAMELPPDPPPPPAAPNGARLSGEGRRPSFGGGNKAVTPRTSAAGPSPPPVRPPLSPKTAVPTAGGSMPAMVPTIAAGRLSTHATDTDVPRTP